MFHVRRRPADCAPRKRKKKPGSLGSGGGGGQAGARDSRSDSAPVLIELGPDGSPPHVADTARTVRLTSDVMEVGSANGIALQLYGPHMQPRHCVIANTDGLTSLTPCHADAHTYVNGQRIYQTTILQHGNLVKFGNSNTYQFLDPSQELRSRHPSTIDSTSVYDRSPRALSPTDGPPRENYETTFDLDGNVETVSTASVKEDSRSLGSVSENRLAAMDRYPRGQDPILPAVLEFPEDPQEQFLARVITHLDVSMPSFKLSPAYTLYLCARYRASTHYRPELTPTERAHKLTLLLQHAAMLIRHTVQERRLESNAQAFWLANASELLHFLKSDRHVSAFSLQAQDTLADAVQSAFRNLVNCLTDDLNNALSSIASDTSDDHPNQIIAVLSSAMSLLRKCRVNAALTIQLFSQLFHWISAKSLSAIINNPTLCTKSFGVKLFNRLRNLQVWAESQGLELAAECHLAKILQCAHLLQASKHTADELANLSAACFKLNSLQIRALLGQYKGEMGEQVPSAALTEQTARAAESVADELTRADGREVRLHEDPTLPVQLLLPDDGFSCDVVQGVPQGLAEFLQPLQNAGLCRLAGQPTSSGHWTVYMTAPRSPSALSSTQPEVHIIRLHKSGGGMGLSIVAAKGAGQERLGIYIKSVVPGGAADTDGRLAAGDQLLSVDGQSLLGITQEKAAEFLVRTGNVVTLEVAKGGAVYHGLATLLQQPSPTPHRGARRMSERDLPSRVDSERSIPSSKSVPALHHISATGENGRNAHDVFNPGYSRTSSNNSINNGVQNGQQPMAQQGMRSRSTHNLNTQQQQDAGFYQNLSVYRNKMPSPQHLGDRTSALRSSQNSLQSINQNQRPASAYYPPTVGNPPRPTNLHQSIPNLKSPPSVHRLQNEETRSGSYPSVNTRTEERPHYNYPQGQRGPNDDKIHYPGSVTSPQYGQPANYPNPAQNQGYSPNSSHHIPNGQRGHDEVMRQSSNDIRYQQNLMREDVFRQSQQGRMDEMRMAANGQMRPEEMMRYASSNNIKNDNQGRINEEMRLGKMTNDDMIRNSEIVRTGDVMRTSKSEDMLRQHTREEMMRYNSTNNIRTQEDLNQKQMEDVRQTNITRPDEIVRQNTKNPDEIVRQHPVNASLRGQAKMAEMSEEVRRRQNRGYPNQYPPNTANYQQYQPPLQYQQSQQQQQNQAYQQQQQYYSQNQQYGQQYQQPLSPSYMQSSNAYNHHTPTSAPIVRSNNQMNNSNNQTSVAQAQNAMQNLSLNTSYPTPAYNQNSYNYNSGPLSPQGSYKLPPTAPKPKAKVDELPPELPPSSTHPLFSASMQEPPKVVYYPNPVNHGKVGPANPWEREEREKEMEVRRLQARHWRDQQIQELTNLSSRTSQQEEQLRALRLEREFERMAQEAEQDEEDADKESPLPTPAPAPYVPPAPQQPVVNTTPVTSKPEPPTSILKPGFATPVVSQPPPVVPQPEPEAPPPPERGSSYAIMSLRAKEGIKRVSFDTTGHNQNQETVHEDPNQFIAQAESMLASPTTPTESFPGQPSITPGVIGAQEVYRDPRTRRLAEQAQQKQQLPVPEKLSFKEKMKMFAMETGEPDTPKDKSKISRAQREIDNINNPSSGLVH